MSISNEKRGKVWFVGAGPGDPELISVKGKRLIEQAGAILYAGSLVSQALTQWADENCEIADSKGMTLDEISQWLIGRAHEHRTVLRLQTGDPSLYGALVEMAAPLDEAGIEWAVVPGISSAMAAAAAARESLTLPESVQSVIFTRTEGRTPMPEGERLAALAAHGASLCLFLSITLTRKVERELRAAGWAEDAPVLVVHKASWPGEEKILRTSLGNLDEDCKREGIRSQAMIIISPALGARQRGDARKSRLYDPAFSHRFRRAARDKEKGKDSG